MGCLEAVGGPAYVSSVVDGVPMTTNVVYYAGIVCDHADARRAIDFLRGAVEQIQAEGLTDEIAVTAADVLAPARRRGRRLQLVSAADIELKAVEWLEAGRVPLAELGLLGGREGYGKSTYAYALAADVTKGRLKGERWGKPGNVIIVATEDSREHTIKPRLMAAGADLTRVFFVTAAQSTEGDVVLPADVVELEGLVREKEAVLVLLDPLMSRLDGKLDSHKDQEVRQALEPLVRLAHNTGATVLGIIHVNKATTSDPLNALMASRAFAAVARFVLFVALDPHDAERRLLGLVKSNLGPSEPAMRAFRIIEQRVATLPNGKDVTAGRLEWLGEVTGTIREAIEAHADPGDRSAVACATPS